MQPVIIQDSVSIASGAIVPNVIALNTSLRGVLECPFPAMGKLVAVQSAAGLLLDLDYGSKNVVSSAEVRVNTFFEQPQDIINDDWYCQESDQISLRCVNVSGGAITLRYMIVLEPMVDESNWTPGQAVQLPPDTRVMQRGPISVVNNTVDLQLVDATRYERINVPSLLRILMTQSAIGLLRTVLVEQDRIAPPGTISITNRIPLDPFDETVMGIEVPANALLQLLVSNNSGGTLSVFWKTKHKELIRRGM
jgi:hypothetical protein